MLKAECHMPLAVSFHLSGHFLKLSLSALVPRATKCGALEGPAVLRQGTTFGSIKKHSAVRRGDIQFQDDVTRFISV